MLCTSVFMDDVTFGRNGPYGETWRLHHREATTCITTGVVVVVDDDNDDDDDVIKLPILPCAKKLES